MLQIKVNENKLIDASKEGHAILLNGVPMDWDIVATGPRSFHILHNNISYNAEVLKSDASLKQIEIKINNKTYNLQVKDKYDLLLEKMGISEIVLNKVNDVKAPMPGLIVSIYVQEGQEVNAGDPLLILEAMKMENVIKASGAGIVKSIHVKKGESVEKNKVLIRF